MKDNKISNEEIPTLIKAYIAEREASLEDGMSIRQCDIPIDDILKYFELRPLELYNLYLFARFGKGLECPHCAWETISADIGLSDSYIPYYRCVKSNLEESHRFNVFTNTIFEKADFAKIPLIKWTRLFVFYANAIQVDHKPLLKEMAEIIGISSDNLIFFSTNLTGRAVSSVLVAFKKAKLFRKVKGITTLGQLIRVLEWVMTFDNEGAVDSSRMTKVLFEEDSKKKKVRS